MVFGRVLIVLAATVVCYCDDDQERSLRFGGGACCPVVTPFDSTIQQLIATQPLYGVFFPNNSDSSYIDSICSTFFPAPDDSNTYIAYFSTVFKDGTVNIKSYILSAVEKGIPRLGSGQCKFTDTGFAKLDCDTNVSVVQRCLTYGACATASLVGSSGVFGLSSGRRPISNACLNKAKSVISNNGLPVDDYIIPPMRLPTRCVLNQVCTVASNLQRFRQTVGVTFPINNSYYANQYY